MDTIEATEGKTTFFVPVQDTREQFPPGTAPVFFNRRMELNRDATVLLLSVLQPSDYLDAMGATGVRGLRVANECGIPVTINDRDPAAIPLIRQNVARSGLPVTVTCRDASSLLSEQSFDAVDIDPFGTPAPFIDAGVRGCRRFLLVTATDTAPLCGAHLRAGIRRYFARPANTGYHAEVGLRILLGFVVRETVKYDRGIEPLFCFAREHFVRLNLMLTRGAQAADRTIAKIGFLMQCPSCAYREEQPGMIPAAACCPHCGKPLRPIGPLYLGKLFPTIYWRRWRNGSPAVSWAQKEILQNSFSPAGRNCPSPATTITISLPGRSPFHRRRSTWSLNGCVLPGMPQAGRTSPGPG